MSVGPGGWLRQLHRAGLAGWLIRHAHGAMQSVQAIGRIVTWREVNQQPAMQRFIRAPHGSRALRRQMKAILRMVQRRY